MIVRFQIQVLGWEQKLIQLQWCWNCEWTHIVIDNQNVKEIMMDFMANDNIDFWNVDNVHYFMVSSINKDRDVGLSISRIYDSCFVLLHLVDYFNTKVLNDSLCGVIWIEGQKVVCNLWDDRYYTFCGGAMVGCKMNVVLGQNCD